MNADYLALSLDAIEDSTLPRRCKESLVEHVYQLPNMRYREALDLSDYENVKARIEELETEAGV